MTIMQPGGLTTVTIPAGEKLIIGSFGSGFTTVSVFKAPNKWRFITELSGSNTFGVFAKDEIFMIEGDTSAPVEYVIGASPQLTQKPLVNGALNLVPLAADPTSPSKGDIYFNSVSNKLKIYNGTAWETVTSA